MSSKVIGIDPGTGRCGYSVVDFAQPRPKIIDYGCLQFAATMPIPARLVEIELAIDALLNKHTPTMMAVETLFFNKNITTAMQVSEARGVIVLTGARRNIPILHCTPLQVKMAMTGYGRADKGQIKRMVQLQFGLDSLKGLDDAIDAVAIAMTGHQLFRSTSLI